MKRHLEEVKKRIDEAVKLINEPLFGSNYKVVNDCARLIVCAQLEINRAMFTYKKYGWHSVEDLPEDEGSVIVSLNGKSGNVTYDHALDFAYYVPGIGFYDSKEENELVEAWMRPGAFVEV